MSGVCSVSFDPCSRHRLSALRQRMGLWMLLAATTLVCHPVWAALPAQVAPEGGANDDNWLSLIRGYIRDGGLVIGLFLSLAGFVWVSWHALADLQQVRGGRKEWGEVGLANVIGAVILLVISYLLNEAAGVF